MLQFKSKGGNYKDINITGEQTPISVYDKTLTSRLTQVIWSESESEDFSKAIGFYPNPFTESLTIDYYLEKAGEVQLEIKDIMGRRIHSWIWQGAAGKNSGHWNGKDSNGVLLPAGMYIFQLKHDNTYVNTRLIKH